MYSAYRVGEEPEDDLYQEDEGDSEASEVNSELEFHLYSQLHYSSNAGEVAELVDAVEEAGGQGPQQPEVTSEAAEGDEDNEEAEERRTLPSDTSNTNLNKKERKKSIKKKTKANLGQQALPFPFEEVIVIDSSPEVISVSDDDSSSDDTGVCGLKGQRSEWRQTSTPAQQGTQKSIRALGTPLSVDSSSSESDSEESESKLCSPDSSDSSDSDDLENWMILGRGNQDGDQSISLNLEGKLHSNADLEDPENWLVSNKDKEAQIYNKDKDARATVHQVSNRYYTSKNVQCRNCNVYGHLSKNCPAPKKLVPCFLCGAHGHLATQCPNRHCNNCGLPGHLYDSCTERAYWHKVCHRCKMTGHFFDVCPEIWRQYHTTIKAGIPVKQEGKEKLQASAYCYNCAKKGHHGYMCTKQRMFNGTYPNAPFVNRYDTAKDMKQRQHRIKLKVKDLKMNARFPTRPQTPSTPEPSKKKPKTSHHKNKHIFFNDSCQPKSPSLKTKKDQPRESPGGVKPWKPKRPRPTSRETGAKVILDEAEDFPRGGSQGQNNKRYKKSKQFLEEQSRAKRPAWLGETTTAPQGAGRRKKKRGRESKLADKKPDAHMYPADENLFVIKQRRRTR